MYLSFILSEHSKDILVNGVITEDHLVAFSYQSNHQWAFCQDFPVLA